MDGAVERAPGVVERSDAPRLVYHVSPGASPWVVFLHGFRSDMGGTKALALEAAARARGWGMLRFDCRGHGASGGDPLEFTIGGGLRDAQDVIAAALPADAALLPVGSSMGGWLATLLALAVPGRVRGLVTVAAAPDFTERRWKELEPAARAALAAGEVLHLHSHSSAAPLALTRALIEDGRQHRVLGRGTLPWQGTARLLHGLADLDVPWHASLELAEHFGGGDVRVTLVKGGDHRLSAPRDLEMLVATVAELRAAIAALD